MSISAIKLEPLASNVSFSRGKMHVELQDGRVLTVPLAWFPRLNAATPAARKNWRLIAAGIGIHWPTLDEDVSIENLLAARLTARVPHPARKPIRAARRK